MTFTSGSDYGTITIYDIRTLIPLKTFPVSQTPVYPLSFSPNGAQVVYCSAEEVHVLNLERGSTTPIFHSQPSIQSESVLSPDGSTIASPFAGEIKLWQCEGGLSHYDPKPSVEPLSVHIAADIEQKIICGFEDGTIVVRDSCTGECMEIMEGDCKVGRMIISHTASLIVASSPEDCLLRLWDYCNLKVTATAQSDFQNSRVRFSIDGSQVIAYPSVWWRHDSLFMERWEICQSPLGLRCLGTEHYDPDQRLTERSPELPHRISEDDQWVVDQDGSRVCWIPPEWRRWACRDFSGSKFVVCADSERMLIVDLIRTFNFDHIW
jgi:WD40 repeat protein